MKMFTADHPRNRSPPGVMSCDEIRWWVKELRTNPEYGWHHSPAQLAKALGFYDVNPASSLKSKIREKNRAWIYPGEQIRMSRQLHLIIAGELVLRPVGRRWQIARAETPVRLKNPPRFRYNLATGSLEWARSVPESRPTLPTFQQMFATAKTRRT